MKIGFIGCGRVGTSFGQLLAKKHEVVFCSEFYHDALLAAHKSKSSVTKDNITLSEYCDVIFITVPDGKIKLVWEEIKDSAREKIICHMSGALKSEDAFPQAKKSASLHPMMAVSDKDTDFSSTLFTIEGNAKDELSELLKDVGINIKAIDTDKKELYHASCVLASNAVIALVKTAAELLEECGFDENEGLAALKSLTVGNVNNIFEKGFENALTGPVDRNDTETVKKHLDVLGDKKEIYTLLSKKLIEIAKHKYNADYTQMEELFK